MISYRNGVAEDVALLQNLNDEVFVDNAKYVEDLDMTWAKGEHGKNYFTQLVNDSDNLCLIAEDDGVPVGYLAAGPKKFSYKTKSYSELENMGVTPKYRSQGIGTVLIKKYFEWSIEQGYESSHVNAFFKNTKAIEFYKENGFLEVDLSLERDL